MNRVYRKNKIVLSLEECIETALETDTRAISIYKKEATYTPFQFYYTLEPLVEACTNCIHESENYIKATNNQQESALLQECIDACKLCIVEAGKIKYIKHEDYKNFALICKKLIEACTKAALLDYNIRE